MWLPLPYEKLYNTYMSLTNPKEYPENPLSNATRESDADNDGFNGLIRKTPIRYLTPITKHIVHEHLWVELVFIFMVILTGIVEIFNRLSVIWYVMFSLIGVVFVLRSLSRFLRDELITPEYDFDNNTGNRAISLSDTEK